MNIITFINEYAIRNYLEKISFKFQLDEIGIKDFISDWLKDFEIQDTEGIVYDYDMIIDICF